MTQFLENIKGTTQLLTDGRLLPAGPNTANAAGSAGQPNQAAPPQPFVPHDTTEEWLKLVYMTVTAFIAFVFSGWWFVQCFELPTPRRGIDHPGLLPFEIMAYGISGLAVLCSAVCLVALAIKICLQVIR